MDDRRINRAYNLAVWFVSAPSSIGRMHARRRQVVIAAALARHSSFIPKCVCYMHGCAFMFFIDLSRKWRQC